MIIIQDLYNRGLNDLCKDKTYASPWHITINEYKSQGIIQNLQCHSHHTISQDLIPQNNLLESYSVQVLIILVRLLT